MRLKVWALAAVAALAIVLPARADLILEYVPVAAISSAGSNAAAITNLNMNVGDVVFLQISLRDTTPGATSLASVGFPSDTAFDARFAGLFGAGFRLNYVAGTVVNPTPVNNTNVRIIDPTNYAAFLTNTGTALFATAGLNFGADPGVAPDPTLSNRIPLFNVKISALAATAGSQLVMLDPSTGGDSALFDNNDPNNPVVIDTILFGGTHTSYPLNVVIAGVPEPSSMILAGLALSGFGYRRLRRKKVVAAV
jgi:hypothetical protein